MLAGGRRFDIRNDACSCRHAAQRSRRHSCGMCQDCKCRTAVPGHAFDSTAGAQDGTHLMQGIIAVQAGLGWRRVQEITQWKTAIAAEHIMGAGGMQGIFGPSLLGVPCGCIPQDTIHCGCCHVSSGVSQKAVSTPYLVDLG